MRNVIDWRGGGGTSPARQRCTPRLLLLLLLLLLLAGDLITRRAAAAARTACSINAAHVHALHPRRRCRCCRYQTARAIGSYIL